MIVQLLEFRDAIFDFMNTGGPVLEGIILLLIITWMLIVERLIFFATTHRHMRGEAIETWHQRTDKDSWHAHQIREMLISQVNVRLNRVISFIGTSIALFPLLGLLGTVVGMIEVFESIMAVGSSDARPMADGISRAIIPTMVGMAGALSGLVAYTYLKRYAESQSQLLSDQLRTDA